MITQTSLGIDITTDHVNLVCLKAGLSGYKITAQARIPLPAVTTTETRLEAAGKRIGDFVTQHSLSTAEVFLSIPTSQTIMRTIEFPLVVKENLKETILYELDKYIPLPMDAVYFDTTVIREDKQNNTFTALLTVIKKSSMEPYLAMLATIGVISGVEGVGSALANGIVSLAEITKPYCVVLQDAGTFVNLALLAGKKLFNAREWHPDGKDEDLASSVKKMMHPVSEQQDACLIIYSDAPGSPMLETISTTKDFAIQNRDINETGLSSASLLPAFGAALRGIGKADIRVNLLPKAFRKKPSRVGLIVFFVLCSLCFFSGMAWMGTHLMRQQHQMDRLDDELARLREESSNIEELRAETTVITNHITALNNLKINRISVLNVLQELSRSIPETAWIRFLTMKNQAMMLDGFAESATELIPLLESSPTFEDVIFKSTIAKGKDGKEIFKISLNIKP